MKLQYKITLVICFLGILTLGSLEFICSLGVKCNNCGNTSISKEESIKYDFYLGNYTPLTKELKLKNHDLTIEFSDAWVEREWFYNTDFCLMRHIEIRDGNYNIIFPFKKSKEKVFLFSMKPILNGKECNTCGGIREDRKDVNTTKIPEIIEIQIYEKNPTKGIGWREGGLKGEKLVYLKNF